MYEELIKLYESDEYPLHMPGHKRNRGYGQIEAVNIDITEIEGYDDLYNPEGFIKEALDRAKSIYNSDKTYFLVNGSTVGILTAVFATVPQSGRILMARNCHKSVYHAVEIRDIEVDFIDISQKNGIFDAIDSYHFEELLKDKTYHAVIITSPTYEGKVSDIKRIAQICHDKNIPLIVDEAHGAHFIFSERFPESAVKYADLVIQSTHKTLPALTQTALLHVNSKLVDKNLLDKYIQVFQTSSPSYILMSSIDSCLKELSAAGEKAWDEFFDNIAIFKDKMQKLKYLYLVDSDDLCKIVVSTSESNINGPMLAKLLLEKYHLQLEMASASYIVAIVTIADSKEAFERLADALLEIDNSIDCSKGNPADLENIGYLLNSKAKDYIYIYPPGIPVVCPGQIIDEEILGTIAEYLQAGLKVRGL